VPLDSDIIAKRQAMKRLLTRVGTYVVAVLAAGCCTESKRDVTITGTVSYDAFQGGEILLMLSEAESSRCSDS
jgi:hypothetical protein